MTPRRAQVRPLTREMLQRMAREAEERGWAATQAELERQRAKDCSEDTIAVVKYGVIEQRTIEFRPTFAAEWRCGLYFWLKRRAGITEGSLLPWWWMAFVKAPLFPLRTMAWLWNRVRHGPLALVLLAVLASGCAAKHQPWSVATNAVPGTAVRAFDETGAVFYGRVRADGTIHLCGAKEPKATRSAR